jgi:heat shock protein HslJ
MNRLLLLALPVLLAGCTKPQSPADAATPAPTTKPETSTPAAPTPAPTPAPTAGAAKVPFVQVATIRAVATLPDHHWRLTDATDAQGKRIDALFARPEQPVTLDFKDGRLNVRHACNRMGGTFIVRGRELIVDKLASTMMACTDPKLMALDTELGKRLQGTMGLRMTRGDAPPQLELKNAAGDVLVFASEETAATKYGSAGERVFLEVAAQTKPCSHPLIPDMQCLQVRELKYDAKGLKVGTPGEFGHFYDAIEGYTHEPGVRNVLRLNRYTRKNVPADASKYAYVLDMVVESDASGKK